MSSANTRELMEIIRDRRSVRSFTGEKIPRPEIVSIIDAAVWAPTGCNNQELRFLLVDDEPHLAEIIRFKPFFRGVSTIVLLFCDMSLPMSQKMYRQYRHERHLPYVDTGLALGHMVLLAKSKGIDSCIFNLSRHHFRKSESRTPPARLKRFLLQRLGLVARMDNNLQFYLREGLGVPDHLEIMCGVAFGYARRYPAIERASHGGRPLMRKSVEQYLVALPAAGPGPA